MIDYKLTPLTKSEKNAIKSLVQSEGWKVIQKIERDQRHQLGDTAIRIDVGNAEQLEELRVLQFCARGRADFIRAIEANSLEDTVEVVEDGTSFESLEKIILNDT